MRSIYTKNELGSVRQNLVSCDMVRECRLTVKNHLPRRLHSFAFLKKLTKNVAQPIFGQI
jgi:hypothetical protein